MTVAKTLGNYAKELLASLKGDEAEKLALHNERRASSALSKQISNLVNRKTTLEERAEDAEEHLKIAKYPTYKLGENNTYCEAIQKAQLSLDEAKAELEDCVNSIEYFTKLKAELSL